MSWTGRKQTFIDRLTRETVKRFNVTVNDREDVIESQLYGLHYCLGNKALPRDKLGDDSHPAKGIFLPPVSLPRRMWAGSRIKYFEPLPVDQDIAKTSMIIDIIPKKSKSGELIFVIVDHEYMSDDQLLISESQTIVYRDDVSYKQAEPEELPAYAYKKLVTPDATQLFRYSASTFNGHRIHYDQSYAINEEGYPGLVVHGPLIATWLMNLAQENKPERKLKSIEYRGNAPAFVDEGLNLLCLDENCNNLEARSENGALIMTAKAVFCGVGE